MLRPRSAIHAASLAVGITASALGQVAPAPLREFRDALPDTTIAYVHADLATLLDEGRGLRFVRMLEDPEVAPILAPIRARLGDTARRALTAQHILPRSASLDDLDVDLELALIGLRLDGATAGAPEFAASLRTADPERWMALLVEVTSDPTQRFSITQASDELRVSRDGHEILSVTRLSDRLILASGTERRDELEARLRAPAAPPRSLVAQSDYARWRELRGDRAVVEIFARLSPVLGPLALAAGPELRRARELGLLDLQAVGFSLHVADDELEETLAVLLPSARRGILRLFDALVPDPTLLDELRWHADFLVATQVDPPELLDVVVETIDPATAPDGSTEARIRAWAAIAASLDGRATVRANLPEFFAWPPTLVEVSVRDEAGLMDALRSVWEIESGRQFEWSTMGRLGGSSQTRRTAPDPDQDKPVWFHSAGALQLASSEGPDDAHIVTLVPTEDVARLVSVAPAATLVPDRVLIAECAPTLKAALAGDAAAPIRSQAADSSSPRGDGTNTVAVALADVRSVLRRVLASVYTLAPLIREEWAEELGGDMNLADLPRTAAVLAGFGDATVVVRKEGDALVLAARSATGGLISTAWVGSLVAVGIGGFARGEVTTTVYSVDLVPMASPDYPGRPLIGVRLSVERPNEIAEVTPGSAAETAGLRVGDVLEAIDGAAYAPGDDLGAKVRPAGAGGVIQVRVRRMGALLEFPVVVGASRAGDAP